MLGLSSGWRRHLEHATLDPRAELPRPALGYEQEVPRTGTVNITSC
jgi:hypothetical protein